MQDPSKLILVSNINVKSPVAAVKFLGIFIDPVLNLNITLKRGKESSPLLCSFCETPKIS
jgi:hypothetical protein